MSRSTPAQIRALQRAPAADLVVRYRERFGVQPASTRHSWLFRRLAWQLQADAHGGLSDRAQQRPDTLMAELPPPPPAGQAKRGTPVPGIKRRGVLLPGTVLERDEKDRTIRVTVLDDGTVEHDGMRYASPTALAKVITGAASINGKLWFGMAKRSRDR